MSALALALPEILGIGGGGSLAAVVVWYLIQRRRAETAERNAEARRKALRIDSQIKLATAYEGVLGMLQTQIDQFGMEITDLRQQLECERQRRDELHQRLVAVERENAVLRERVQELESENARLRVRHDEAG